MTQEHNSTEFIYDVEPSDMERFLLGKSIVEIKGNTLTLSDGTTLEFQDSGECCAYFYTTGIETKSKNIVNNVITNVTATDLDDDEEPVAFQLNIIAENTTLASVPVYGDPTSGYYCSSIALEVRFPKSSN